MPVHRYAFNAGEIAPELHWRSDLERYNRSCRYLTNFLPKPQGAIKRRPGTNAVRQLEGATVNPLYPTRAFPFPAGDTSYIVTITVNAAGNGTVLQVFNASTGMRVYIDDAAPWAYDADLTLIQVVHSYDVMYLVHPDVAPQKLSRYAETDWHLETLRMAGGPVDELNTDQALPVTVSLMDTFDPAYPPTYTTWAATTKYHRNDLVTHSGANYRALRSGKNREPDLEANRTFWTVELPPDTATGAEWDNGETYAQDAMVHHNGWFWIALRSTIGDDPDSSPNDWKRTAIGPTGNGFRLSLPIDYFSADDVGRRFLVRCDVDVKVSGKWTSGVAVGTVSPVLPACGTVLLTTEGGVWEGLIVLQKSLDGGTTWTDLGSIRSEDGNHNGQLTVEVTEFDAIVRAYLQERSAAGSDTGLKWTLEAAGNQDVAFQITDFEDAKNVVATSEKHIATFPDDGTPEWGWMTFCDNVGYPGAVAIFEQRLIFSGVRDKGLVIYGSVLDDWENWRTGSLETDAFVLMLDADTRNDVRWMMPLKDLIIGTNLGEWALGPRSSTEVLSALNLDAKRHSTYGSAKLKALAYGARIFFLERGTGRVMALGYDDSVAGYRSADVTIMARHLLADGIIDWTFACIPEPTIFALTGANELISYTFDLDNDVTAWAAHDLSEAYPVGGSTTYHNDLLAVVALPGAAGDDVWFATLRNFTIGRLATAGLWLEQMVKTNACLDGMRSLLFDSTYKHVWPVVPDAHGYDDGWGALAANGLAAAGYFINILPYGPAIADVVVMAAGVVQPSIVLDCAGSCGKLIFVATTAATITVSTDDMVYLEGVHWEKWNILDSVLMAYVAVGGTFGIYDDDDPYDAQLVEGADYWIQNNGWYIIPGGLSKNLKALDTWAIDHYAFEPVCAILCPALATTVPGNGDVVAGVPFTSLVAPTDPVAGDQAGGPGGHTRVTKLDAYVVESLGGEVSGDDGASWASIPELSPDIEVGAALPVVTGKYDCRVQHGWQSEGCLVRLRNATPHQMMLACLGWHLERSK